jgi:hypothetical protein
MSCKGAEMRYCEFKKQPDNAINADSEKWRSFVAPLFTAGYGDRYTANYERGYVDARTSSKL